MKANELMIGDWVRTKEGAFKVSGINDYDSCNIELDMDKEWHDEEIFAEDEIEPIPLTEEIFKANFKEGAMDDFYYTDGIEIYVSEAGVNVVAYFGNYGSNLDFYCLFVHQLQHALRLCGINDLADNFKIK